VLKMSIPTRYDLESKIYANLKALEELHTKFEAGNFSFQTYRKMIQVRIRDLLFIDAILRSKGLSLTKVTKDMKISQIFVKILPKISKEVGKINNNENLILGNKDENDDKKTETSEYQEISAIPNNLKDLIPLSSKITSDFITIIDFLKLKLNDIDVLKDLISSLLINLEKFPNIEELYLDIKVFSENNLNRTIDGDELANIFETYYLRFKKSLFS
jgi:hypothetical protein